MAKSEQIKARLQDAGIRYWAGDNISEVLHNQKVFDSQYLSDLLRVRL